MHCNIATPGVSGSLSILPVRAPQKTCLLVLSCFPARAEPTSFVWFMPWCRLCGKEGRRQGEAKGPRRQRDDIALLGGNVPQALTQTHDIQDTVMNIWAAGLSWLSVRMSMGLEAHTIRFCTVSKTQRRRTAGHVTSGWFMQPTKPLN